MMQIFNIAFGSALAFFVLGLAYRVTAEEYGRAVAMKYLVTSVSFGVGVGVVAFLIMNWIRS